MTDLIQTAALRRAQAALSVATGEQRPTGQLAAKYLAALAASETPEQAHAVADARGYEAVVKAAIGAFAIGNSPALQEVGADFLSVVRARSLVGRMLARMRKLPPNATTIRQTGSATAGWVPEGQGIGMSVGAFAKDPRLSPLKVAGITAVTLELARAPGAESLLLRDLASACAEAIDRTFASTAAAVTDESPAGAFRGAPAGVSSGPGADGFRADLDALLDGFGGSLDTAAFVADARTAMQLATLEIGGGISMAGESTLAALPMFFSDAVPRDSDGGMLGLIDLDRVQVIGFEVAELSVSREGSLVMDNAPSMNSTTPTAAQVVSLFQSNTVGLRGIVHANWRVAPGAAALVSGVNYGPVSSL